MQRNKDTVYVADRQEYLQACAKYAEYVKQDVEQRIAQLRDLNSKEYDFAALSKKIFEIIIVKAPLQRYLATANQGAISNEALIKESIYLLKQMYSVDLIEQYLPLIKSTTAHLRKSDVIVAMQSKKLSQMTTAALYQHLLTQLESTHVVCEALTLLTGEPLASPENLLRATYELIESHERNTRRQATAAIAFELLWVDGQKLLPMREHADPLLALTAALQRMGVGDAKLLEFLLEFVNQQALLRAEKFHDDFLKKILVHNEKSVIEAHISYLAEKMAVIIKIVRKYPALYPNDPSKQPKHSMIQDAVPYTRVCAQSVTTLMISNHANMTVDLFDGSLEIFDQRTREFFLKISAVLQGKKILSGTIGSVNGEIIVDHVLNRYQSISDENELKKALVENQDALAVLFLARTNPAIMKMILNSDQLLQCICTDKYCDKHVEMLCCLYSKDVRLCADLSLLADCIKLIRSKNKKEMIGFVKTYFMCETVVNDVEKDVEKNREKHRQADQNAKRIKYLIAALFAFKSDFATIVELLKINEVYQKLDKRSLVNLASRHREVAQWMLEKQANLIDEQLTSEQIVTMLLKQPRLWSTIRAKGSSRGNPHYARLNFHSLCQLVVSNRSEDSRKYAAKSIFKSTTLLPKLCPLSESDPGAFLLCCVDADANYFDMQDEIKKNIRSAVVVAKSDAVHRYLKHLSVVFAVNQWGLFIQEMYAHKLTESLAFDYFVSLFTTKVQQEPNLEYEIANQDMAQLLLRLLPLQAKLGIVLQNNKMREFLFKFEDRNPAWGFFNAVMENADMQWFHQSKFQLNAFTILRRAEIEQMVFEEKAARFILALFSKDHDAMALLPLQLNLILKYATGYQLLLILLRATEQIHQLRMQMDPAHKRDVLANLEGDKRAFIELNRLSSEQASVLSFLETVREKILSAKHYLQQLFAGDSVGVAERALLIKIAPEVVQSLYEFGLIETCQQSVANACLFLSPFVSQSDFLTLSCVHPAIDAAYTAKQQEACEVALSVNAIKKIRAIQQCAHGNLMAKALIGLCHVKTLAVEALPALFYENKVISVLTDGSNTDASLVVALIKKLSEIHVKYAQEFANAYLLAAFSHNDILLCILSTPSLQSLLISMADVGVLALLLCLHGKSFNKDSDWICFFERLIQLPVVFAMVKPTLFYYQQQRTFSSLFHFVAIGLKDVLTVSELKAALNEGAFSVQDFIILLLREYQQNGLSLCHDHLILNAKLRNLIFNQASVEQLIGILNHEKNKANVIEKTLLSSPVIDDILRLGQPDQLLAIAMANRELLQRMIRLFVENPLQREFIMQSEPLFKLLLETAPLDEFLAMGLLIKQPHVQFMAKLMLRTDLVDIGKDSVKILLSAKQLVNLLIIAEQQQFQYTRPDQQSSQLKSLCNQGELIVKRIFRAEINTVLCAIPLLLRYLEQAKQAVLYQLGSEEFFSSALNDAAIDAQVNFICASEVRQIIVDQSKSDLHKRIRTLLCQCFIHANRSQLIRLCDPEYVVIILDRIAEFFITNDFKKKIIAKRLIFLLDHFYHTHPHFVVESLIGYEVSYMAQEVQQGVIYFSVQDGALHYQVRDPKGGIQKGVLTHQDVASLEPAIIQAILLDKNRESKVWHSGLLQNSGLDKLKAILSDILNVTAYRKHTNLIHYGHLFELILSTESNLSLFVASSIYQGSERIRQAVNNQFAEIGLPLRARHASVSSLQQGEDSEGSSADLKSAIKKERNNSRFSFEGASGESTASPKKSLLQASLQNE